MKESVREAFPGITAKFEGKFPYFYLDILGLVTIAYGNLADSSSGKPPQYATALPMLHADGTPATELEIATEWMAIKARSCWDSQRPKGLAQDQCAWKGMGKLCLAHAGAGAAKQFCKLHLDEDGLSAVVLAKFDENTKTLARFYPNLEDAPADAQLATMSMAWACGPAFHTRGFGALEDAINATDWEKAAAHCEMNASHNRGLIPRNAMNKQLYLNAAKVRDWKLDPESLVWPAKIEDHAPAEAPTTPELPVLEDDGGASRHDATSAAIFDLANDRFDDDDEPPSAA
jgi:GH24 family phage-related lysozyme (muramidase)